MIPELKDYEEYLNIKKIIDNINCVEIKQKYYLDNKIQIESLNNLLLILYQYVRENARTLESILVDLTILLKINFQFRKIIYTDNGITIRRGRMYRFRGRFTLPTSSILDLKFKHTNEIEKFILSYVDKINLIFLEPKKITDVNYRTDFLNDLKNSYDRNRDEMKIFDSTINKLSLTFVNIARIHDIYLYDNFILNRLIEIKDDLITAINKLKKESCELYSINEELKEKKSKYDLINGL